MKSVRLRPSEKTSSPVTGFPPFSTWESSGLPQESKARLINWRSIPSGPTIARVEGSYRPTASEIRLAITSPMNASLTSLTCFWVAEGPGALVALLAKNRTNSTIQIERFLHAIVISLARDMATHHYSLKNDLQSISSTHLRFSRLTDKAVSDKNQKHPDGCEVTRYAATH